MADKLFYMQGGGQYVGNCVLWWAKDYSGYTCDLHQAHIFTEAEAKRMSSRDADIPWPKEAVDKAAAETHHVDMQKLRRHHQQEE